MMGIQGRRLVPDKEEAFQAAVPDRGPNGLYFIPDGSRPTLLPVDGLERDIGL